MIKTLFPPTPEEYALLKAELQKKDGNFKFPPLRLNNLTMCTLYRSGIMNLRALVQSDLSKIEKAKGCGQGTIKDLMDQLHRFKLRLNMTETEINEYIVQDQIKRHKK